MNRYLRFITYIPVLALLSVLALSHADETRVMAADATSTSFISRDSVIVTGGGYASSTSFQLYLTPGIAAGQSTSTSFINNAGFLAYPVASSPTLTASGGDGQVSLSWTASEAVLGWTVSGYQVGRATSSGGPYTFSTVGNVTSSTATSLSNGTTYYFVIRVLDAQSTVIATSSQVSAAPVAAASSSSGGSSGGGGGGGGGGGIVSESPTISSVSGTGALTVSGVAFPYADMYILSSGVTIATTTADAAGIFTKTISNQKASTANIRVQALSKKGYRSLSSLHQVAIQAGRTASLLNVLLPPTLTTDKASVKAGESVIISGNTAPSALVYVSIASSTRSVFSVNSDERGIFSYTFATRLRDTGSYRFSATVATTSAMSISSDEVEVVIGNQTVTQKITGTPRMGNLNGDAKVDIKDFSILAFWLKRPLSSEFSSIEKTHLNGDGKVDLRDFSIVAYHWRP